MKGAMLLVSLAAFVVLLPEFAEADLPVHCVHSQVLGKWSFHRGPGQQHKKGLTCSQTKKVYDQASDRYGLGEPNFTPADKMTVHLKEPNVVEHVDSKGVKHTGTWTMIYDEGFEVNINNHKYFAFSYFKQGSTEHHKKSVCHITFPGWYHNAKNPDGKSWGCYYATKETQGTETEHLIQTSETKSQKKYVAEHDLVSHINSKKSTWKAKVYPEFQNRKMHELHAMGGGVTFHEPSYRAPSFLQEDGEDSITGLPKVMDWRNHDGQNYVGPVVNQGSCGSCYAVAVTDMIQSRVRVLTKNRKKPKLSAQKVLSCNEYGQGCKGGFPFLVGKYSQDYGMSDASAQPYVGQTGVQCKKNAKVTTRSTDYHYVGGYYGACNYKKMMHEIHKNGPLVVGFNTEAGLWHYDSGVYEETSSTSFLQEDSGAKVAEHKKGWGGLGGWKGKRLHNHWEKTTHAVLVVGWGENKHQGKYWIVKNSWGPNWGENGYFRTKRGVDSCAMESMAVAVMPTLGDQDYFQTKAEELGEEADESKAEPPKPKKSERKDFGESADMNAVEEATRAKPIDDDIHSDIKQVNYD